MNRVSRRLLAVLLGVVVGAAGCSDDPTPADAAPVDAAVPDAAKAPDGPASADGPTDTAVPSDAEVKSYSLTILHTGDLHSHFMGHSPETDYTITPGDDTTVGGYARLATALGLQKMSAAGRDLLTVDAGDFMMGTLFAYLAPTAASELKLMQAFGYDAVALGNHEFDWTPAGLAKILAAAGQQQVTLPILASNLMFSATDMRDDPLAQVAAAGGIKPKFVKTLPSGLKVGLFGLVGKDAARVATSAPAVFTDYIAAATAMVKELREQDKVDLVVALSHSGIAADGTGEDHDLAVAVPDLDVIVSGHTHDKLTTPIKVGKTFIVAAGAYAEYLGRLDLEIKKQGDAVIDVTMSAGKLVTIDDMIPGDPTTQAGIDMAVAGLDLALMPAGLGYKKVVAETDFDLPELEYQEFPAGNLVVDAYRAAATAAEPTDPAQIAIEANGSIRTDVKKGKTGQIWFADLFRLIPFGIGPDAKPGYPLVTFYVNGKDVRAGFELSLAAKDFIKNDQYFLQMSGVQISWDSTKLPFGRVTGATLIPTGGAPPETINLDDTTKCYKVVTTLYVASLLGAIKDLTGGKFSVDAKDKDCATNVSATLATRIVHPAGMTTELKNWQALVGYVLALPDTDADGIPNIPAALYTAARGNYKSN
jgi:5'-nucleotidase/UDP-sugar diphosphatase